MHNLGLIFLKYIFDRFEELYNRLQKDELADPVTTTSIW